MQIMLYNVTLNNKAGGISVCKTRTMLDEPVSPLLVYCEGLGIN